MKKFISFILLTLSACGQAIVVQNGSNLSIRYGHEWLYSPALGTQKLNKAANKNCSSGKWEILEEIRDSKAKPYGATEWKIKCL